MVHKDGVMKAGGCILQIMLFMPSALMMRSDSMSLSVWCAHVSRRDTGKEMLCTNNFMLTFLAFPDELMRSSSEACWLE